MRVSPRVERETATRLHAALGLLPVNGLIGVPDHVVTGAGCGVDTDLVEIGAWALNERYAGSVETLTLYLTSREQLLDPRLLRALDDVVSQGIVGGWGVRVRTVEQATSAVRSTRVRRIEIPFGGITDDMLQAVRNSRAHMVVATPASVGAPALFALAQSAGVDEIVIEVASDEDVTTALRTMAMIDVARGATTIEVA
ncbi:MAG: hypothetical protein Q4P71_01680 [Actinomycetaceae bacterium]|nr:hypothetical protein [Actinomycetaceae bacterium]